VIEAVPGACVRVRGRFENEGFERVVLRAEELVDTAIAETVRMRGYRMVNRGAAVYRFEEPGEYEVCGELA